MLLHLPIMILATLSPTAVSDTLPKFDVAKECGFEGGSSKAVDRCSHDEADALQQLEAEWPQFVGAERSACVAEATVAGSPSYVELLICLEMARDLRKEKTNSGGPLGVEAARPEPPERNMVDKRE